ncbi:MAG: hypothetical protein V1751_10775 [Pseudomonadota bacterium]
MVSCHYPDSVGLNSRSGMNEKSKNGVNEQVFHWDLRALRLPRLVEADPRGRHIPRTLATRTRPLWQGSETEVPACTLSPELVEALRNAHRAGQVVRGLESAARRLANENRGLGLVDRHSGVPRGVRVSRLLVMADDGAERFYRQMETLLRQHGPRLLALRLDVDAEAFGALIFGPGRRVRLLMLDHKEAVSAFLLALPSPLSKIG